MLVDLVYGLVCMFFKQKTAYEMRISDWSSDVCSSELETPSDGGMELPVAMGSAVAINFQPTGGGKAAITGDFVLTASEVNPVLHALRENGIEVTALHNHMLDDEPRLFFMHLDRKSTRLNSSH